MHEKKLALGVAVFGLVAAFVLGTSLVLAQNYNANNSGYSYTNTNSTQSSTYLASNGATVKIGDLDGDGVVGGPSNQGEALQDILVLLRSLYCPRCPVGSQGATIVLGCLKAADVDGSGTLSVADAIRYILYAFGGGPGLLRTPSTSTLTCGHLAPTPVVSTSPTPTPTP